MALMSEFNTSDAARWVDKYRNDLKEFPKHWICLGATMGIIAVGDTQEDLIGAIGDMEPGIGLSEEQVIIINTTKHMGGIVH